LEGIAGRASLFQTWSLKAWLAYPRSATTQRGSPGKQCFQEKRSLADEILEMQETAEV
jgi:hypothetical protein